MASSSKATFLRFARIDSLEELVEDAVVSEEDTEEEVVSAVVSEEEVVSMADTVDNNSGGKMEAMVENTRILLSNSLVVDSKEATKVEVDSEVEHPSPLVASMPLTQDQLQESLFPLRRRSSSKM